LAFDLSESFLPYVGIIFLMHFLILWRRKRLTSQTAQRSAAALLILLALGAGLLATLGGDTEEILTGLGIAALSGLFLYFFLARSFWVYSMPCTFLSSLPLAANYLFFGFLFYLATLSNNTFVGPVLLFALPLLYFLMSSYWFPRHRRLGELWRPRRIPRLRTGRNGLTLIELLIAIAITAIMVLGIAGTTSQANRAMEFQRDRTEAVSLAEDEIALLRSRETLPEVGVYPVEPELAELHPLAERAEVEIRPGPHPRLREARVTVRLGQEGAERDVVLAVLLPLGPEEARP
jgi:prepilin-type N-terminal cleavage/methylation domain-containing protein